MDAENAHHLAFNAIKTAEKSGAGSLARKVWTPDQILRRREMPKNANGKIDRKELTRELEEQAGKETE